MPRPGPEVTVGVRRELLTTTRQHAYESLGHMGRSSLLALKAKGIEPHRAPGEGLVNQSISTGEVYNCLRASVAREAGKWFLRW
jgi:hypothetical protein